MKPNSFKIENVVSTTKLSDKFNLDDLKPKLENAEYNKSKFPGLVYRITDPKAVFLLFNSGKVVCTGSKSIENAKLASDKIKQTLVDIGEDIDNNSEVIIQNIVSSADLGSPLNLNSVTLGFGMENIEYEPEQFPGLVYRMDVPKVVILLFGSGKLVITGGKSTSDCGDALVKIKQKLVDLNLL